MEGIFEFLSQSSVNSASAFGRTTCRTGDATKIAQARRSLSNAVVSWQLIGGLRPF
jgi:hypothetical protein